MDDSKTFANEAQLEARRQAAIHAREQSVSMAAHVQTYGAAIGRGIFILNGGAAVATLAFASRVFGSEFPEESKEQFANALAHAIEHYAAGLAFSLLIPIGAWWNAREMHDYYPAWFETREIVETGTYESAYRVSWKIDAATAVAIFGAVMAFVYFATGTLRATYGLRSVFGG